MDLRDQIRRERDKLHLERDKPEAIRDKLAGEQEKPGNTMINQMKNWKLMALRNETDP